jgi:hypothetical protein
MALPSLTADLFQGRSSHPLHCALRLPIHIIKLAHLACSAHSVHLASLNQLHSITFTQEEALAFKRLQIQANLYLHSQGLSSYAIYYLTPNMLLPYQNIDQTENCNQVETMSPKKNKSKKSKRKKGANAPKSQDHASDNLETPVDLNNSELVHPVFEDKTSCLVDNRTIDPFASLSIDRQKAEAALEGLSPTQTRSLLDLCAAYEDKLQSVREIYEDVLQSLHLRIYLVSEENDRLKEEMKKS